MSKYEPNEGEELPGADERVYRLESKLEKNSSLWKAYRKDEAKDKKAIKIFESQDSECFELEQHLLQALGKEGLNVPRYITSSPPKAQARYIIMEYVQAENLWHFIAKHKQRIDTKKAVQIILEVLPVLAFLHRLGYAYLDFKPENLLWDDAQKKAWLVDFGSTKKKGAKGYKEKWSLSQYAAPELESHKAADCRSDIYSAAVVLLEMLADQRAVFGENDHKAMLSEVKDVSLREIIGQAIDGDPSKRTGSILELAIDLYRFTDGTMQQTIRNIIKYSLRDDIQKSSPMHKRRAQMIGAFYFVAVAILAVLLFLCFFTGQGEPAPCLGSAPSGSCLLCSGSASSGSCPPCSESAPSGSCPPCSESAPSGSCPPCSTSTPKKKPPIPTHTGTRTAPPSHCACAGKPGCGCDGKK